MTKLVRVVGKGGKGSGNFGHAGRPGKVGGSAPQGGGGDYYSELPYEAKQSVAELEQWEATVDTDKYISDKTVSHGIDNMSPSKKDSSLKDSVATNLSDATGVDYDTVSRVIDAWGKGSNAGFDGVFIQKVIADVFGDKFGTSLSDWQLTRLVNAFASNGGVGWNTSDALDSAEEHQRMIDKHDYPKPYETMKELVLAMYNQTQKELSKYPGDYVKLYRGIVGNNYPEGEFYFSGNAAESWSSDKLTALVFSMSTGDEPDGSLLEAYMPKERILSTPFTGFGKFGESEFVVVGGGTGSASGDRVKSIKREL